MAPVMSRSRDEETKNKYSEDQSQHLVSASRGAARMRKIANQQPRVDNLSTLYCLEGTSPGRDMIG